MCHPCVMRWLLCLALAFATPARSVEVDVELALMVDVSRSMESWELELQRRGYAEAIASDQVIGAILNSFTGRIALTYVEWAGNGLQREIIPWTLIDSADAARTVAARLTAEFIPSMRRTSISGAIEYARIEIGQNAFEGLRQVIDISGDGPNNDGMPVERARDRALEDGIVINGLPLMTYDGTSPWGIPDLDRYYQFCVIGGPGAFVIPVLAWEDFPMAVRRKIVLELVGPLPAPKQAASHEYDCLIGEKRRRQREMYFSP